MTPDMRYGVTQHTHDMVEHPGGSFCIRCMAEFDGRQELLARSGLAAGAIRFMQSLVGRDVRIQQFADGAWINCRVLDWEYPNCCILSQDHQWDGHGRERWLRVGWCGAICEETNAIQVQEPTP